MIYITLQINYKFIMLKNREKKNHKRERERESEMNFLTLLLCLEFAHYQEVASFKIYLQLYIYTSDIYMYIEKERKKIELEGWRYEVEEHTRNTF